MKVLVLSLLCGLSVFAQSLHFGVRAGVPLTDAFHTGSLQDFGSNKYFSDTKLYTFGPTGEVGLPARLSIEADLLYKRLDFDQARSQPGASSTLSTTANSWEVPITMRHRFFHSELFSPYARAGASFRKLTGVHQESVVHMVTYPPSTSTTSTDHPSELQNTVTTGLVLGVGLDLKLLLLHLTPEIRYTRWNANLFEDPDGLLKSQRNQVEFLVGLTW